MQDVAWYASIFPIFLVILSFSFVFANSGQTVAMAPTAQERLRKSLLLAFLAIGVPLTIHSLADLPYPSPNRWLGPAQKIEVVGRQWSWTLSKDTVKAGELVEFRVGSEDVNHGFGIYDTSMRVVAQTQAMPGYVNVLRYRFKEPGTYKVLCLEYCGVAHHDMSAEIHVLPE